MTKAGQHYTARQADRHCQSYPNRILRTIVARREPKELSRFLALFAIPRKLFQKIEQPGDARIHDGPPWWQRHARDRDAGCQVKSGSSAPLPATQFFWATASHDQRIQLVRRVCSNVQLSMNPFLRSSLYHHVEWSLGRPTHSSETTPRYDLRDLRFASLGAEPFPNLLIERGRNAYHGRSVIVETPHRVQIFFWPIVGHGLDDHPRSIGLDD